MAAEPETEDQWKANAIDYQKSNSRIHYKWKIYRRIDEDCVGIMKTTIGLILYGAETKSMDENLSPNNYYTIYSKEKIQVINHISCAILDLNEENIALGWTFLPCRQKDRNTFIYPLIRILKSDGSVLFFDPVGRCYKSWCVFIDSNKLPTCIYVAPNTGVYRNDTVYEVYSKVDSFVDSAFKYIAVGGLANGLISPLVTATPVAGVIVGVGAGSIGAISSVRCLRDRFVHGQSIAPTNRESLYNYGMLSTSILSTASVAALKYSSFLEATFGSNTGTILKSIAYTNLVVDGVFMANTIWTIGYKYYSGERVTYWDALNVTLEVFLFTGTVVQVNEMQRMLNQRQGGPLKLTPTQKRRAQKKRAKLRASDGVVKPKRAKLRASGGVVKPTTPSQNSLNSSSVMKENDVHSSIYQYVLLAGKIGVQFMLYLDLRVDLIGDYMQDILVITKLYFTSAIRCDDYVFQLNRNLQNLILIISEDTNRLRSLFTQLFPIVLAKLEFRHMLQDFRNVVDRIQQNDDVVPNFVNDDPLEENEFELLELHPVSNSPWCKYFKIITRLATDYSLRTCTETCCTGWLENYRSNVQLVSEKLLTNMFRTYDQLLQCNRMHQSEENAIRMSATICRKFQNDLYPDAEFLEEMAARLLPSQPNPSPLGENFDLVSRIYSALADRINSGCDLLYVNFSDNKQYGLKSICLIVEDICNSLIPKCCEAIEQNSIIFRQNVEIVGETFAKLMMQRSGVSTDEFIIFENALNSFSVAQIMKRILEVYSGSAADRINLFAAASETAEIYDNHDKSLDKILVDAIWKVEEEIVKYEPEQGNSEAAQLNRFRKIAHFFGEEILKELVHNSEQLKQLSQIAGKKYIQVMFNSIKLVGVQKRALVDRIVETMVADENLTRTVSSYLQSKIYVGGNLQSPNIYDCVISDGILIQEISCNCNLLDDEYFEIASKKLPNLGNVNYAHAEVFKTDDSFVIIHDPYTIMFKFNRDENTALLILIDNSKNIDDDDGDDELNG